MTAFLSSAPWWKRNLAELKAFAAGCDEARVEARVETAEAVCRLVEVACRGAAGVTMTVAGCAFVVGRVGSFLPAVVCEGFSLGATAARVETREGVLAVDTVDSCTEVSA